MAVGGEYENKHLTVFHLIHQTMIFGDAARPLASAVAREWVGMACSRVGVFYEFSDELGGFLNAAGTLLRSRAKSAFASSEYLMVYMT